MRTTMAAGVAAVALALQSPADAEVPARVVSATGAVHSNSRDGQAVLTAANMRPGASATGTVTIANSPGSPGSFTLEATGLTDVPGPGGGHLTSALKLSILDQRSGRTVYSGPLNGFSRAALGTWAAGESRTYRFDVALPSSASSQNSLQSSRARVSFRWRSADAPAPTTPTPTPTTPAPTPVPTTPTPTPVPPPPAADTTPPKLKLVAKKRQKVRRRTVQFTATCDEDCRIVGTSLKGAKVKAPSLLKAGKKAKIVVKLSKKDAKKYGSKRKAVIKLKVTAADMNANRGVGTVKIALKR